MSKIEKIVDSLELIYYEYNAKSKSLVADKQYAKKHLFDELIKITHAFTTNNITFYVDSKQRIFIDSKESLKAKLERFFGTIYREFRNSGLNIYLLSDKKVKWAKNLPIFGVEYLAFEQDFSEYDALIFTSKNAIYAVDAKGSEYKKVPAYVIAPQSAKVLKGLGGNLKFTGKQKHGDAFARELLEKLQNKKVLYLRGKSVVSDLVNILNAGGVVCDERVVYKTECTNNLHTKQPPKGSAIIFSSPSTIECFLKNMEWDESYIAIAIGNTTASYFPEYITPIVADTTSLDACVKKAIELISAQKES